MDKVKVYYAGIPKKNTSSEKIQVLKNFHKGVPSGLSEEVDSPIWKEAELGVIQGWVHSGSILTDHLRFRKTVIDNQLAINKYVLAIDSNLFLYKDPGNTKTYLRFSLNDVFPNTGIYFRETVDPTRWKKIKKDLNIDLIDRKPNTGKHILICMQRNGGWSMGGMDANKWLKDTIQKIRLHTDRPITVRPHPGDKKNKDFDKIARSMGAQVSKYAHLLQDFHKCYAVVTYNSSPGVAAAIEGLPVFVTDPEFKKSQAWEVANLNLRDIDNPNVFDRKDWIEKLSMCHFNFDDLVSGAAWDIIKEYIR